MIQQHPCRRRQVTLFGIRGELTAFTLVELLAVIAIVGMLIALLLPALQSAREAGRRSHCSNNIRQVALGAIAHEAAQGFFPSGGWANYTYVGDADHGFGRKQDGGEFYSILPYVELQPLHSLPGDGNPGTCLVTSTSITWSPSPRSTTQLDNAKTLSRTLISLYSCPTRRPLQLFECDFFRTIQARQGVIPWSNATLNSQGDTLAARGDYAFNGQTWLTDPIATGICYQRSEVRAAHVRDGLSNTYLCGEKYLNPMAYFNGLDGGDNESWATGQKNDTEREASTNRLPLQDTPGVSYFDRVGSAHPGGLNMAMCDGSVRPIAYGINGQTHQNLGQRNDRQVVDMSGL
jgi:prepilin-type processing-associated H-X9-DG protein